MGVGIIGPAAGGGGGAMVPAGAGEKVADVELSGYAEYDSTLPAGDYIINTTEHIMAHDGKDFLGIIKKNSPTKIRLFKDANSLNFSQISGSMHEYGPESVNVLSSHTFYDVVDRPYAERINEYWTPDGTKATVADGSSTTRQFVYWNNEWRRLNINAIIGAGVSRQGIAMNDDGVIVVCSADANTVSRYSTDGGETWADMPAAPLGSQQEQWGQIVTVVDGTYFATFHYRYNNEYSDIHDIIIWNPSNWSVANKWRMYFTTGTIARSQHRFGMWGVPGTPTLIVVCYAGNNYGFNFWQFNDWSAVPNSSDQSRTNLTDFGWENDQAWVVLRRTRFGLLGSHDRPSDISTPEMAVYMKNSDGSGTNKRYLGSDLYVNGNYTLSKSAYAGGPITTPSMLLAAGRYNHRADSADRSSGTFMLHAKIGDPVTGDEYTTAAMGRMSRTETLIETELNPDSKTCSAITPDGMYVMKDSGNFGRVHSTTVEIYQGGLSE